MQRKGLRKKKLSVFTYFFIFFCIVGISLLFLKELNISDGLEEILYQKEAISSVEQENKFYISKIKNEYGIVIEYGDSEKVFVNSVNANVQYDENIVNNNLKIIYDALKKYPKDTFKIFKDRYNLNVLIVSSFEDNNIALASKNNLNQYKIYISNNENFERAFHHEFFHVLEYYMKDKQRYLYKAWNSYNPVGFTYSTDLSNLTDEYVFSRYGTDEQNSDVYFLTKYSKVSEKEDRAEIFAELMILNKSESYLKNGSNIKNKVTYLLNELYENISVDEYYFSQYIK